MEDLALVRDLSIVWLAALMFGWLCVRLKLPVIAGYIIAGLVVGPFGARLISEMVQIKVLAELGVALLLFALGVELSIRKIFASTGSSAIIAACQIGFTVLAGWLLAAVFGIVPNVVAGIIFGFVCTLSSTAVVTKMLLDRSETETLHGRVIVPLLLIQDLMLVPVVALLPALQQSSSGTGMALLLAFGKATLLIIGVVIGSIYLVPRLLASVSKTNSRELFLLTVVSLCLVVALLSRQLGVSLALGAFLSGIMISEQPYGHQVLSDIMPLRDLFATLFFVSIGMLLNPVFIASHWMQVGLFVLILIAGKALIAGVSSWIVIRSAWSSILIGLGLAQIGEFSFVLATLGNSAGLLPDSAYNLFFAGAVVSLIVSPALTAGAPKLLSLLPAFQLPASAAAAAATIEEHNADMNEHLVLCGFGRMGRSIGLTLQSSNIPFVVIELDGHVTHELDSSGIPFIYGDAFSQVVLSKARLEKAACLVLTLPDALVSTRIMEFARSLNPDIRIVARANRLEDIDVLRGAGANSVVQPEFEASLEATKMALVGMGWSGVEIINALRNIRERGDELFRGEALHEHRIPTC